MRSLLFLAVGVIMACTPEEVRTDHFYIPEGFPEIEMPATNAIDAKAIDLGKQLFFDPKLSANGKVSCMNCHMPGRAFSDGQSLSSMGVTGKPLTRHSPALINTAWMENGLFWDGGAKNLESLIFAPLTHPDEMAADLEKVEMYVTSEPRYAQAIKEIYHTETVKVQYVAKALAQYVRTLISDSSKYDLVRSGQAAFSEKELKGYRLFQQHCADCHQEPLLTDNQFHNNGLDRSFENDTLEGIYQGRFRISHDSADLGKYKTPTLRNVAVTAPYMHDGRLADLEAVLLHYTDSVQPSASLDSLLMRNGSPGLNLTRTEKDELIAFLNTLTDYSFLKLPE